MSSRAVSFQFHLDASSQIDKHPNVEPILNRICSRMEYLEYHLRLFKAHCEDPSSHEDLCLISMGLTALQKRIKKQLENG